MRASLPALRAIALAGLLLGCLPSPAQNAAGSELAITQRYDLRRRLDGKYSGVFYGFSQTYWRFGAGPEKGLAAVQARSYLTEESIKDLAKSEKTLRAESSYSFALGPDWSVSDYSGDPSPLARGFPSLPDPGYGPGSRWEAPLVLAVDPKGAGPWTRIKALASYELARRTRYQGREALELKARFAIRYRRGQDPEGDPDLASAEGTREALIYLDAGSLVPVFIRETLSGEAYRYADGGSVQNDGFILSFFSGGEELAAGRKSKGESLARALGGQEGLKLEEGERGISLTLQDLKFAADSPELLPGEEGRLDAIARALRAMPADQAFLVVGHTAAVGTRESQLSLSLERARRVAAALAARGLDAGRFIVDGKGGDQPIGDDGSEEGRALNRRVEILLPD